FGASIAAFLGHGNKNYIALTTLVLNLAVAVLLTLIFRTMRLPECPTNSDDYYADEGAPGSAPSRTHRLTRHRADPSNPTRRRGPPRQMGTQCRPAFDQ